MCIDSDVIIDSKYIHIYIYIYLLKYIVMYPYRME